MFSFKKMAEEWRKIWREARPNYKEELRDLATFEDEFLKILDNYITRDSLILEAGCGFGVKCIYFNQRYGASCVGIDMIMEPLKKLQLHLKVAPNKTDVVAGDVRKLPFREHVFDVGTSLGVVEHFEEESDALIVLDEASRVLKRGCFLILTIPNFSGTFRNKLLIVLSRGRLGMYHKTYTKRALLRLFNKSNLQIVEVKFLPFGFRKLVFRIFKSQGMGQLTYRVIYMIYHAAWELLNLLLKVIVRDDYQNPILVVARKLSNNVYSSVN